jgi:hypothetical protein
VDFHIIIGKRHPCKIFLSRTWQINALWRLSVGHHTLACDTMGVWHDNQTFRLSTHFLWKIRAFLGTFFKNKNKATFRDKLGTELPWSAWKFNLLKCLFFKGNHYNFNSLNFWNWSERFTIFLRLVKGWD